MSLPTFPLLSADDFAAQCHIFVDHQAALREKGYVYTAGQWELKEVPAPFSSRVDSYLELRRRVASQDLDEEAWGEEDMEEEDAEALPKLPRKRELELHYNIVYSVSYRVPVLYFTPAEPLGVEETVRLVSKGYPHGAVTQQEHPLNGEMWWFVHPCHTAEFMREFEGRIGEGGYLVAWLGVVGAALAEVGSVKGREA